MSGRRQGLGKTIEVIRTTGEIVETARHWRKVRRNLKMSHFDTVEAALKLERAVEKYERLMNEPA